METIVTLKHKLKSCVRWLSDDHQKKLISTSGIYQIQSTINDKWYIGSAINLKNRHYWHFHRLKLETHYNILLQNHANKHGIDNVSICLYALERKNYATAGGCIWENN